MMQDDARKKIAALLEMAADRGATEAEAMAAAERAARLMAEHGLSQSDVEFDEAQAALRAKRASIRDALWGAVAACTNCAAISQRNWDPAIIFIGRAPGPEIAAYLVDVLNRVIDSEVASFKESREYKRRRTLSTRRAAVQDFTQGLVARLQLRLVDLFQASMSGDACAEARAVRDVRFPDSVAAQQRQRSVRFGSAAASGYSAGSWAQISHGVGGGRPVRLIEAAQ